MQQQAVNYHFIMTYVVVYYMKYINVACLVENNNNHLTPKME